MRDQNERTMHEDFLLRIETRIGLVGVQWNPCGLLTGIRWIEDEDTVSSGKIPPVPAPICRFLGQLQTYFESGEPLGEIPWGSLDVQRWSAFQSRVYTAISKIPHGETRTYGWVASRIGTLSSRAVGQALKRNPYMVLIPCHRVLPTTGGLGGFMGEDDPAKPELQIKKRLLELEEGYLNPTFSFLGGFSLSETSDSEAIA
jgi:methylated-DNA-[protein]-cysteine S-methyltransferase